MNLSPSESVHSTERAHRSRVEPSIGAGIDPSFSDCFQTAMNRDELEQTLRLQSQAFKLLMWIGRQSRRRPELLSAESVTALKEAAGCMGWLSRHREGFPRELRPAEDESALFAHLLSSFFNTSFHVEEAPIWNGCESRGTQRILRPGLASTGGKGKGRRRTREQKQLAVAAELQRLALASLAEELGCKLSREQLEHLAGDEKLSAALNLWSYAFELHRRARFASQGPAVHRLWQTLDAEERTRLDVNAIWPARDALARAIQGQADGLR